MKKNRIVAVIPIKLVNMRFPGKNIKPFDDGTPLMALIQRVLLKIERIERIYVYCSDEAVKPFLLDGVSFLKRDPALDADTAKGNDIYGKFVEEIDADYYVLSHATAPFTEAASVEKCIDAVMRGGYDSALIGKPVKNHVWYQGKALNFDPFDIPRTQDLVPVYTEASGAHVFSKETFQKYHSRNGERVYIHEATEFESIDIDYPDQFALANQVYMKFYR